MPRNNNKGKGKQKPVTQKQAAQIIMQESKFAEKRSNKQRYQNKGIQAQKKVQDKVQQLADANRREVLKLTQALTTQEGHYVLPREVSGIVSANTYQWTQELTLDVADPKNIAFILRPEVANVLSLGKPSVAHTTSQSQSVFAPKWDDEITTEEISIWFDVPIPNEGESTPTIDHNLPYKVIGDEALINGGYVLPVNVGGAQPATMVVGINNQTAGTYSYSISAYGYTGELGSLVTTPALTLNTTGSISTNATATVNFHALAGYAAWWTAISAAGVNHLGFTVQQTGSLEYKATQITYTVSIAPFLIDTGYHWTNYSLYDLMPVQSNFKSIFQSSDSYSITGFNVLLSNVTPVLDKGGSIFAAQLPGRSEDRLPKTFSQLLALVKAQKMRTLRENQLALGAHYNWVPEKPNDVWFYPPADQSDRPFGVACITVPGAQGLALQIVGQISIELMTTDPVLVKEKSPANAELAKAVVSAWSEVDCWTHNPSHLDHLAKAAKKIATSPQVHQVLFNAAMAGLKYGPMVVAALSNL